VFESASGPLRARRSGTAYVLDFPARPSKLVPGPATMDAALGRPPREVYVNEFNYMAVFGSAATVRSLRPDMEAIKRLDYPGVIVTAPGDGDYDFVSRYFAPAKGIPEDPVTGAAHCMLAPYWARALGKSEFSPTRRRAAAAKSGAAWSAIASSSRGAACSTSRAWWKSEPARAPVRPAPSTPSAARRAPPGTAAAARRWRSGRL
jgi:predicted PhzF superfamily epimerase YddE/YHI9